MASDVFAEAIEQAPLSHSRRAGLQVNARAVLTTLERSGRTSHNEVGSPTASRDAEW